jgi:hypothetical protein
MIIVANGLQLVFGQIRNLDGTDSLPKAIPLRRRGLPEMERTMISRSSAAPFPFSPPGC